MPFHKLLILLFTATLVSLNAFADTGIKGAKGVQEGVHYEVIKPAQPTSAPAGKVEVTEFFWYGCPHCFRFEPYVKGWLKKKSDDIVFRRVPAMLSPKWESHARAYYAAEVMGVTEKLHEPLFLALHAQKKRIYKEEDILDFVEELGIDRDKFMQTYKSFAVSSKIQQSKKLGEAYNLGGVPSVVVNGKYLTSASHAGSYKALTILMNALALKELEALKGQANE
jgi:thiol:disulfide interchange protein DsbA